MRLCIWPSGIMLTLYDKARLTHALILPTPDSCHILEPASEYPLQHIFTARRLLPRNSHAFSHESHLVLQFKCNRPPPNRSPLYTLLQPPIQLLQPRLNLRLGLAPALPTALPYTFTSSLLPAVTAPPAHHVTQSKRICAHRPFFNYLVLPVFESLPFRRARAIFTRCR